MARSLSDTPVPARRRLAWILLVLAVLAAHGWITAELAERMEAVALAAAMPERLQAVYVRELQPAAPPAVAPAPPPPAPKPRRVRQPAPAASAVPAVAEAPPPAASEPAPPAEEALAETVVEPPPPVPEPSASEPLLAAAEPAASAPEPAASAPPPFEWPGATRLSYKLTGHVRGEVHGDAQVEWLRQGTRYQVHVDVTVGLPIAPLLTRRSSSEGELTEQGLVPRRYDEDTKRVFSERRRVTLHFEPDAVLLPDGRRRERWPGTQDAASQFVQLSWLFTTRPELLREGGSIEFGLALPKSVDRWTYDVLGQEPVTTLFGQVDAFHLKPRRLTRPSGELVAEIWFAPTLRYLPARIRIQQDPETFIDLVLARKPELGAP
jgi:hypothetical protein